MKHYSTQELLDASKKVPLPIQEALSSDLIVSTISGLGAKFQLHIDQIGLIAELNVQTLLGLIGPEDFFKELIASGISDKDARDIMSEINQKIFVPLRKEEENGPTVPEVRPSPEIPKVEPQIQPSTSHFHLVNKIAPPHIAPLPPKVVMPTRSVGTLGDVVRAALAKPGSLDASKLLEDHEEPHMEINKIPSLSRPAAASNVGGRVKLQPSAPPSNLPGMMPGAQSSAVIPSVESQKSAPITSYAADPYREPIDEIK
ncbi:MAG: hypothetical protein WCW36_00320 [Candidatus Paceibacterota bacterium]|jgi:hypothetical protein